MSDDLKPGWLGRDIARASARVTEWKEEKMGDDAKERLRLADELSSFSEVEASRSRKDIARVMRQAEATIRVDATEIATLEARLAEIKNVLNAALAICRKPAN